jgi:hypothetical protein
VIIISEKSADPAYDKYPFIKWLTVDKEFLEGDPITVDDLASSLLVFDDIESLPKLEKEAVFALKKRCSLVGRSSNIYIIVISHLSMRGDETKTDLSESDGYVVFPHGSSTYHLKRQLKEYAGLSPKQIAKIMRLPTRWVYIKKTYPQYVVSQYGCYLLGDDDE